MRFLFTNVEINSKIWKTSALHWFDSILSKPFMHLCCELVNVAKYAFFGVIFWLKNGGLGIFWQISIWLPDPFVRQSNGHIFFNLRNFLYMQMHSDFPTHECIKENLIFILFTKTCVSFLSSPALWTRTWTLQRSALA